ncbi:TatD family hydrolase [Candidatus Falkowbacteria bacterium]|nr:TatD family hydrolase [Candidatus Falkowbacteria bacterium]
MKNTYKIIDSHAHVNFNAYKDDAEAVLERAFAAGIGVINVGSQLSTSQRAVDMANSHESGIWAVVGVHPLHLRPQTLSYQDDDELEPVEIKTNGEEPDYAQYAAMAEEAKVVAIGEVGLDYHHFEDGDDVEALKAKQKEVLIKFIEIANQADKPVALHCWDGYSDLLEILVKHPVKRAGVVHSFIGGYKTAKKFIELGYVIGLNGVITYADSFDRLVREVDLEHMILETDCPYLSPAPNKGERNEPTGVIAVAIKIAAIKNISVDEVVAITTNNSKTLFRI